MKALDSVALMHSIRTRLGTPEAFATRAPTAKRKHSGYGTDEYDWYVEPSWCTDLLLDHVDFSGTITDPACGAGTIPKALSSRGFTTRSADIVDRGLGSIRINFLADFSCPDNIVTNPPYRLAEAFVRHALEVCAKKTAVLVRLDFLASQRRYRLFADHPPALLLVLSRRPSMPPGWIPDVEAKGGMHDYCWLVWDKRAAGPTLTKWAM